MSEQPGDEERGGSLSRSAGRGAMSVMAGQIGRILVLLAGIVILSRLLTPADYGLMAMITAIVGVGEIFRDFGLQNAAVQAKTLSKAEKGNLFWANTGIGVVLAILIVAGSWPISWLYGEPRLQPIAAAMAATFLLTAMTTQFTAQLTRSLKLMRLVAGEIAGQLLGLATAIVCAIAGLGVWSLALQQIVQALATLLILAVLSRWLPGLWARGVSIRRFLSYGAGVAGAQLLGYLSRSVDSIVIGARFGATSLGLYNRAFQLMLMPLHQLNAPAVRVALPVLSRLQDERERFRRYILAGQFTQLMAVGAIIAVCFSQAHALIEVAIGSQWAESVPYFRILAIGGLFQTASAATYWAFLAKGLTGAQFRYALVTRPIMIGLLVLGSLWGVEGVAWMYTASLLLFWPIGLIWIGRISDVPAWELFWNAGRAILVIGVATGASWLSTAWLGLSSPVLSVVVGGIVVLAVIGLAVLVFPRFRRDVAEVVTQFRSMRRKS